VPSTARDQVKCIFASFSLDLVSGGFTVNIFYDIFHCIFRSIMSISLPNNQKWSKNVTENEPKMSQKFLLWTTLMRLSIACFISAVWNFKLRTKKMAVLVKNFSTMTLNYYNRLAVLNGNNNDPASTRTQLFRATQIMLTSTI
jgi:hypothetical protein